MAAVGVRQTPMGPISRRKMLAGMLGGTAGLLAGCSQRERPLPPGGEILSPNVCARPPAARRFPASPRPRPVAGDRCCHRWRRDVGARCRVASQARGTRAICRLGIGKRRWRDRSLGPLAAHGLSVGSALRPGADARKPLADCHPVGNGCDRAARSIGKPNRRRTIPLP